MELFPRLRMKKKFDKMEMSEDMSGVDICIEYDKKVFDTPPPRSSPLCQDSLAL